MLVDGKDHQLWGGALSGGGFVLMAIDVAQGSLPLTVSAVLAKLPGFSAANSYTVTDVWKGANDEEQHNLRLSGANRSRLQLTGRHLFVGLQRPMKYRRFFGDGEWVETAVQYIPVGAPLGALDVMSSSNNLGVK